MELLETRCPHCQSARVEEHRIYQTKHHGQRRLYQCQDCRGVFSETKQTILEGLRTPISRIIDVISARSEGLGLNAVCRVFHVTKKTVVSWEQRFAELHEVLWLYALTHVFLQQIIEGDEAYTKVAKNVPPEDSRGWTIMLMDRASRFLWELRCGRKDRKLFLRAIQRLCQIIERTQDLALVTDGERRYGNILFEIYHELLKTGRRGRPKKTLRRGVLAALKNKGSQTKKRGRKRPKYQRPWPTHPQTPGEMSDADIHANHVEAFISSLRRRCSAFRRKTNTYAKTVPGLQRILNIIQLIHNYVRPHFTTQQVPAVALSILERGLSLEELMQIQIVN